MRRWNLLHVLVVVCHVVATSTDTCTTLVASSFANIEPPLTPEYVEDQSEYWSTSCSALLPSCIITPESSQEVAAVLAVLANNTDRFAVKSGGHNPNNYFASVDGGPLISTKKLNQVILDPVAETVKVGPGNRWDDVASSLDGTGYTVVGGRIGNVGSGGLIMGGGLSFLSTQHGWAADNVLAYEIVLANSSIVTASATKNPDLFAALKGAGNVLGIVTTFTLKAYKQSSIWGGAYIYQAINETSQDLLQAIRDFAEYYPDEKAAIIPTSVYGYGGAIDLWILFLFYDGSVPPAGVFDNFTAIGPIINTCKTQSYRDLLSSNDFGVLKGTVYMIGTETTPVPAENFGPEVMEAYYYGWRNEVQKVLLVPGLLANIAFQPAPKLLARLAKASGGDLLDLDDEADRIVFELTYSFLNNADYPIVDTAMQATYSTLHNLRDNFTREGLLPDVYLPLFMNDAYFRQDYFARLRPKSQHLISRMRNEVDPQRLFTDRTGGFKI